MMGMPQTLRSPERRGIARRAPETRRRHTFAGRLATAPAGAIGALLESQRLRGNASTAVLAARRVGRISTSRVPGDGSGLDVSSLVRPALQVPGKPLDAGLRSTMETALETTIDDVRVHEGGAAGISAELMGAAAYSIGRHIVFGPGSYSPGTQAGQRLLAHELAHTRASRADEAISPSRFVLGPSQRSARAGSQ